MRRTALIAIGCACAAISTAAPLIAAEQGFQEVRALWLAASRRAEADPLASLPLLDQAIAASPGNNGLVLSALTVALKANDITRARLWLELYARQGGALRPPEWTTISRSLGIERDSPIMVRLARNAAISEAGSVAWALPSDVKLIEGVAYDRTRGAIFVSSVVGHRILRSDRGGRTSVFVEVPSSAGAPMALVVDPRRSKLWAALSARTPGADRGATGGLLEVDLTTGASRTITGSPGAELNIGDVTVDEGGTAYASDARNGSVYRCEPGCARLRVLVPAGVLQSAQGLVSRGRRLYVADYAYGIAIVDLDTGSVGKLTSVSGTALDGIDGMVWDGKRIVAVQNGVYPARVVAIRLDASGRSARRVEVIERAHHLFDDPTQVAFTGNGCLLVANAQWRRYDEGTSASGVVQGPTFVIRLGGGLHEGVTGEDVMSKPGAKRRR